MKRDYDKLVRDNIPDIIHEKGNGVSFRILDKAEFKEYLDKKLDEEVAELREAVEHHPNKILEELADIEEVLYAMAETHGHTVFDLGKMRRTKLREKGGFVRRICLIEVEEND